MVNQEYLNLVVFEERMVKSWLLGDMNTVYYATVWTLFTHTLKELDLHIVIKRFQLSSY